MDLDNIPGLAAARAWEASTRAEAFLDAPQTLCGVEVLPLTLRRMGVLVAAANPFLCGGPITQEAVAGFLWVLSPRCQLCRPEVFTLFCTELGDLAEFADLARCHAEVSGFLDVMFMDAPASRGGDGKTPTTSSDAVFVDLFADAYHWTVSDVVNLPLPQLYQLLRRITLRRDPKAIFINRSDKARGDWLRSHQEAAEMAAPVDTPPEE